MDPMTMAAMEKAAQQMKGTIYGSANMVLGAIDKYQARRKEKKLGERPLYNIATPTLKNQGVVENLAQQGLSDASILQAKQSTDDAFSGSIDALIRAGGGVNSISELFSNVGKNSIQLAVLDDQARFRNQQLLVAQNDKMADELDKRFQMNTFAPWVDAKQAIAEQRARGDAKIQSGLSMIAGNNAPSNPYAKTQQQSSQQQPTQTVMNQNGNNSMDAFRGNYDPNYNPSFMMQNNGQTSYGYNWDGTPKQQGNYILQNLVDNDNWYAQ